MPGEYEPNDSRNVTGMSDNGMGSPGGADQQLGAERWGGDERKAQQQAQFEASGEQGSSGQQGGGQMGGAQPQIASQIREHMEVIGADGTHVGTVDRVEGHRIKLARSDSGMGSHEGHHHFISLGLVAGVEGDKVRLSANGDIAYGMEEEE